LSTRPSRSCSPAERILLEQAGNTENALTSFFLNAGAQLEDDIFGKGAV
jgi:hypothetical protein